MADPLYLSVWFPSFSEPEMLPRTLAVMRQFPFSPEHPGIVSMAVHAISFSEPPVYEQTFDDQTEPTQAIALASEFVHDDHAFEFEAVWDLWVPRAPSLVRNGREPGAEAGRPLAACSLSLDRFFLRKQ